MYKKLILIVCLACLFLVTGCSNEKSKTLTCTRTATIQTGVDMSLNYKVTYKGENVLLVESEEKITSDDADDLKSYETTINNMYSPYKDLEHYYYNVSIDGNTLTSTTKIDYEKIDTDRMIEIDSKNSTLIKNGKVNVQDLKSAYETLDVTCQEGAVGKLNK